MTFRNKKYLYILINLYLNKETNEIAFCDAFYKAYNLGEIEEPLSHNEDVILNALSEVAGRFSPYDEDHIESPGALYTKEELAAKILETKQKLMKIHPEYFDDKPL